MRGDNYRKSFQESGNTQDSVWSCGQSIGLIDEVLPCAAIVSGVVEEAADIIRARLPSKL